MPRLTDLDDVLFPVAEHPVFSVFTSDGVERKIAVPAKKAIVHAKQNRVLGIVSRDYRLVTNEECLEMARLCCQTIFPETKPGEWETSGVDAPSTAGYCHIDLSHNSTALDFSFVPAKERPEAFGPFIRVTNSYNGLRALGFDIGFFRKVCKNGMIVPDSIINFKFSHMRREIGETIRFEIARDRLSTFKAAFTSTLSGLRECALPLSQFEPVIMCALQLRPPQSEDPSPREMADWESLIDQVAEMSIRYADELGENAYATFNVITEFASRPPENLCVHRDRHSLQRLAGSWLTSFTAACRTPGFSISKYLDQIGRESVNAKPMTSAHARANRRHLEEAAF
jgi:hypothetical protein